jgi:hypothetical protein
MLCHYTAILKCVKLATRLHLAPMPKKHGMVPLPPLPLPRAITTCTGTTLPLPPSTFTLKTNSVYHITNITFENACKPVLGTANI